MFDRSIKTEMQPAAWLLLLLGFVGLFLLGYIFVDGILLVLSVLCLVLFFVALLWGRWNISKLSVEVKMPERVYAGKGVEFVAYLDNHKLLMDSFGLKVSVHILHSVTMTAFAGWVANKEAVKLARRISVPLRGTKESFEIVVESSFPLSLFKHSVVTSQPRNLIVYPRLITPLEVMTCGSLNDIDPQRGIQLGDAVGEPRGIRAWRPGDSAKRIHWPASARALVRGQGLRLREYDPPGFAPVTCLVLFHSHADQGEVYRQDRFERAASLAAGTLRFLHGRQVEAKFTADFLGWRMIDCETRSQYIELLAIMAQAKRSLGTQQHDLQSAIDDFSSKIDQLVIVSDMDPDSWSEGLTMPDNTLVIDIRQMHFGRRGFARAS